jgi:AraC-like DNA-binding protein
VIQLDSNKILLLPPHTPHKIISLEACSYSGVKFECEYPSNDHILLNAHHNNDGHNWELMNKILDPQELNQEVISHYLHIFFLKNLLYSKTSNHQNHLDVRIRRSIDFMKLHIFEQLTLDDLAQHVLMSKSHYVKLFKKEVSNSPLKHFRSLKIDKAKEMLLFSEFNISQVANVFNFCDIQSFSRYFKTETQISPRDFIEKSIKNEP